MVWERAYGHAHFLEVAVVTSRTIRKDPRMMESGVAIPKLPKIDSQSGRLRHKHPPPYSGLSGPSYSLSGLREEFKLPPASVLQPGMEQHSGQLDSWPVHSIKPSPSNLSIGQNPNHKLSTQKDSSPRTGAEWMSVVPKPKFLEQLEAYLQKELRLLGCPSYGPHELRLQAHREVFEYLIEDFRTYKPLLSSIKNEYELFIRQQEEIIRELEPMKAQLDTVREECERKLMAVKEEEKGEEAEVQRENRRLLGGIANMKAEELSYKTQIDKLQVEIAQLYEKYRNEADARKLLVADYNDLKFRQQEQKSEEVGQEEREDPVILKLKLARSREDLRAANLRINTMLADYGDVVPRREFEMLETSYKNVEAELEILKSDHTTLIEEHNTLQSMYKDVLNQRDKTTNELARLKRSATPRPDWDRCAGYIEGGAERWAELSEGRSSDQVVDVLLAQIAGVDVSEIAQEDAFQGQGLGEDVPKHLRVEGPVRNRRIDRKETNDLISGFWQHRLTTNQEPLSVSLYSYLLSRNKDSESLAVEDGYNLEGACARFVHEPHIALFTEVVSGEVDEAVFHHWLKTQTSLTEAFSQTQQEGGHIPQATLEQVLTSHLPTKPTDNIKALLSSAEQTASPKPGTIDFIKLMSPDPESGQPSSFVQLLLEQCRQENKEFVTELAQTLGKKSEVSIGEVQAALQSLDPTKPSKELHSILAWGFSLPVGQVREATTDTISLTRLLERLQHGNVYRSGPR